LPLIVSEIGAMLDVSCQLSKFRREGFGNLWRISESEVFIWLKPTEAVPNHHAASDSVGMIWPGTVHGRSKEADRITRPAFGHYRIIELIEALNRLHVRTGIYPRCAVFGGELGERPDDVEEIFVIAFAARPHVVIAMRELFDLSGMDGDGLCDIKLDLVASVAEYLPSDCQDQRLEHEITRQS